MCGRAAVIRRGMGLARAVGARRIIAPAPGASFPSRKPAGDGGFFKDAGGAHGHAHAAHDDAAAPAAAAASSSSSSSFPDVTKHMAGTSHSQAEAKEKQSHGHGQAEQLLPSHATQTPTSTTQTATTETHPLYEVNYNCGPTSTVPVWRLQTAEEQRELLQLEKTVESESESKHTQIPAVVKHELDELAADALKSESTHHSIQSVPVVQYMRWGFPNPMAGRQADGGFRSTVFNARSESVDEKRMFRELVHKKRCVVLVDGFYEWHTEYSNQTGEAAKKQGYFFHMPLSGGAAPTISLKKQQTQTPTGTASDDSPFPVMHLAGLYDAAINDETGETTYNVVVLTCGPSKEMSKIHTRMPVILSPADAARWVDVDHHSWKDVKSLCKPFEGLGFYAVPAVVNNARNHGVECIEPLDAYTARQKAGGIAKFFSPVASPSKSKSPVPSSSGHPKKARSPSPGVGKGEPHFFNPHGAPGKTFSGHVNPADPGQTGGSKEPAVRAPSTATSDAAVAAEEFVLQKEHEVQEQHEHESDAAGSGSKRKHPASSSSSSSTLPLPATGEDWFDMDDESMPFQVAIALDVEITPTHNNKKQRAEEKS